ncbi:unnamed protein product [Heligmosomoides polygyrus]|uniref:Uncharacterized protein n=1 Tax=Heligmosomoides polygyrus TaxID=6339 RepID=A0A183FU00_HELPZ|nr:unnamed protein product [Heligmosomoides polygyrus]
MCVGGSEDVPNTLSNVRGGSEDVPNTLSDVRRGSEDVPNTLSNVRAPADVVFPGVPQLGGQLYDSADNGPRFMLHPDVVNAVVREPHVRAGQRGRGAQPRHQGAGLPPHMVRLPHVDADQEGMGIREVISEMMEHLFEVQNRYLNLHAMLMADGERVPANAVIEPYAFHLVNNAEGLEQRDVEHYRAYLSETYARFAREDDMLNAFLRAIFDMHARVLFLLDVHIDARI